MANFDEQTISVRIQKEDWEFLVEQQNQTGLSINDLINIVLSTVYKKPISDKTKKSMKQKGF